MRAAASSSASLFCTSRRETAELSAAWRGCSVSRICCAALGFEAVLREREHAVDSVPELGERLIQIDALVAGGRGLGIERFLLHGVQQIGADAFELRNPGNDRIGLAGVLHIAHGQTEGVEIVLDAEKLQGIAAIAVDHFALHDAQAGELDGDVGGVREHG